VKNLFSHKTTQIVLFVSGFILFFFTVGTFFISKFFYLLFTYSSVRMLFLTIIASTFLGIASYQLFKIMKKFFYLCTHSAIKIKPLLTIAKKQILILNTLIKCEIQNLYKRHYSVIFEKFHRKYSK
jgi:hypothetical protein